MQKIIPNQSAFVIGIDFPSLIFVFTLLIKYIAPIQPINDIIPNTYEFEGPTLLIDNKKVQKRNAKPYFIPSPFFNFSDNMPKLTKGKKQVTIVNGKLLKQSNRPYL